MQGRLTRLATLADAEALRRRLGARSRIPPDALRESPAGLASLCGLSVRSTQSVVGAAEVRESAELLTPDEAQTGVAYATLRKHYAAWVPQASRGVWDRLTRANCAREDEWPDTIAATA